MVNTTGTLDPPFGNTRLQVMKLLVAMMSARSPELSAKLVEHDVFNTVLVSAAAGSSLWVGVQGLLVLPATRCDLSLPLSFMCTSLHTYVCV